MAQNNKASFLMTRTFYALCLKIFLPFLYCMLIFNAASHYHQLYYFYYQAIYKIPRFYKSLYQHVYF